MYRYEDKYWLGMHVKKSDKCTDMKIKLYSHRDKIRAYNRTVNGFLNQATHSDTARCDSESIN